MLAKSLVFSQFTSALDYIKLELPKHGFQYRTLSGDMPMRRRAKALHDFQTDPPTTIFLLSMRAGAVGINLTQANRVFLLEPCFNPAVEAQSIGRVYRLVRHSAESGSLLSSNFLIVVNLAFQGQTRPVEVVRLCMKDSVEERMMTMLRHKYGDNPRDNECAPLDAAAAARANNTLVGSVNVDRAIVLAAEFDLLFGYNHQEEMPGVAEATIPELAISGVPEGPHGLDLFENDQENFDEEDGILPDIPLSFPIASGRKQQKRAPSAGLL